jgi:hypothetical protein
MRRTITLLAVVAIAAAATACGGEPSTPLRPERAGTYVMTELSFDPMGVLPQVDVLARLGAVAPQLLLTPRGDAQLIVRDPDTGLIISSTGRYTTPQTGVRIDFGEGTAHRDVLLPRRIVLAAEADGSLTFDEDVLDGVSRQRLVQLVTEWAGEQLLDPVPGRLTVTFSRLD